ncbi:FecCD family ABC transporter permease [Microvirga thermotolerans]|uniref:Iron chelate uptake ABC transporter family permease subunit n=1 Tax=Microvirga thermotolerans TaxID=2651334 RepID=A0A5P9JTC5_9HYPH|nr:iron ABC transporter permease [Microvirga thermotolerans]QFU14876.1 iron chelate uptake ABC transporter family permease subunit [Microvirga thermotolerans]
MTLAAAPRSFPEGKRLPALPLDRRPLLFAGLLVALAASGIAALGLGATGIPAARALSILAEAATGRAASGGDALIVLQVRLPRLLLGLLVGAALASSGALMQGLFRNPLADPGLVGVSAGAALAAAATIVLGDALLAPLVGPLPFAALPLGAFAGGLLTTLALYRIATRGGRTSMATLLLAGVAFGALSGAVMGLLSYVSDDRQLRDLAFWSLGSLSGATWTKVAAAAALILPGLLLVPALSRGLNALALGEAEAYHLGVPVQRVKAAAVLTVAVAVGTSVACAGMIGFVGIVVPHVLRLLAGPDHRMLLPASALAGAALLVAADTVARTLAAPAELPIGILTALIGAPFFLWLLLRRRGGLLT